MMTRIAINPFNANSVNQLQPETSETVKYWTETFHYFITESCPKTHDVLYDYSKN